MDQAAAQAFIRFGLGRRGAEPEPADPRRWLLDQLDAPDPGVPGAPSTADGLRALHFDRQTKPPPDQSRVRPLVHDSHAALVEHSIGTDLPFRERLVWFWTNHFTVSVRQGGVAPITLAFMQEAIRPHVTGRFVDMLVAVMTHPAMLMYLDNNGSVGPDSEAGIKGHKGLNENLARECMELHTLSPAAGYTQADVTEFAKVLTGWSVELNQDPPGTLFRPRAHEPGQKTVLGQRFREGPYGLGAALQFFAGHPGTHRFLATKLVRHFVADDPPPAAVRRVEAALRGSQGDLGAAARALVAAPEAWHPMTKLRPPQDYVIAVMRAADLPPDNRPDGAAIAGIMGGLGQPLFNAPLPNGWSDRAADWAGPEEMMRRVDWAYGFAGRLGQADPARIAEVALGPFARAETASALAHAGSRREAMAMLLTSPEFQRR